MKCIIPAAGYGTRVGMQFNQSKEMLPDHNNFGKPLIQWSLDLCKMFKMEPLIITREDKKDLRQYLFNNGVKFIDIEVEGEWNQSVLKSIEYWNENNILMLPDTRFDKFRCIQDIQNGLKLGNKSVFAMHKVNDPENWGVIKNYILYEKNKDFTEPQWAWGLIGFQKFEGECIFQALTTSDYFYLRDTGFTYLNKFEDLTRGSK